LCSTWVLPGFCFCSTWVPVVWALGFTISGFQLGSRPRVAHGSRSPGRSVRGGRIAREKEARKTSPGSLAWELEPPSPTTARPTPPPLGPADPRAGFRQVFGNTKPRLRRRLAQAFFSMFSRIFVFGLFLWLRAFFFAAMSCSKGSKGGGRWNSWPPQGSGNSWPPQGSKGSGGWKSGGGGGRRKTERPVPRRFDDRMQGDETYQKYLDAGDLLAALIYEVGGFFGRGGPSSVYICPLPPRAAGGVEGASSDRPGAVDRFWHTQRSQMPGEVAKHSTRLRVPSSPKETTFRLRARTRCTAATGPSRTFTASSTRR
jgi:hypothetical protein